MTRTAPSTACTPIDAFGDLVQYQAKAVIVATGGFADDDRRMTKWGFDLTTLERIGTPGHFGDGINMTIAAGARGVPTAYAT